jgi:hypothetical protein
LKIGHQVRGHHESRIHGNQKTTSEAMKASLECNQRLGTDDNCKREKYQAIKSAEARKKMYG